MKNLLIGSVAASIALLVWGFVFWALLAEVDTMSPDAELALQRAIAENVPETGTYVIRSWVGMKPSTRSGTIPVRSPCSSFGWRAPPPCHPPPS